MNGKFSVQSGRATFALLARMAIEMTLAYLFGFLGMLQYWRLRGRNTGRKGRRILLLRFGLLGDAVLWIPALKEARRLFPTASLETVVSDYQYEVLKRFPYIDDFMVRETSHFTHLLPWFRFTTWKSFFSLVRLLRRRRYDTVISCYGRMGARLGLLSGAVLRCGYLEEADPFSLTHSHPGRRYSEPLHETEYNLRIVKTAAAAINGHRAADDLSLTFSLTSEEHFRSAALLGDIPDNAPLVGIHPGASNGAAKRWLPQRWAQVADILAGDGVHTVLLGSESERALAEKIASAMRHPVFRLDGATENIGDLAAVLSRCNVIAAGDTGPLHLAVALGRPVVAVHGPTDPRATGPAPGVESRILKMAIPCSPCYNLRVPADCPLGHTLCMRLLPVAQVVKAIRGLL